MKHRLLIFFFWYGTLISFSFQTNENSHSFAASDVAVSNKQYSLDKIFNQGKQAYINYEYADAIRLWKSVLEKADPVKDSAIILRSTINIGSGYNALGFHKTALGYFLKTHSILSSHPQKDEKYWINHINIGVCYMSLEQYDLAHKYFIETKAYTPYVGFVKKLNLAKWHALQGDRESFYKSQVEVSNLIKDFPSFSVIWEEMQLEFLIQWQAKEPLALFLKTYGNDVANKNLLLKILYNQAHFRTYKTLILPINELLNEELEVLNSQDLFLKEAYFDFLKEYYYALGNLNKFYAYVKLAEENKAKQFKERNMLYVEDFKEASVLETLKNQYQKIKLKNKLIEAQLAKSQLLSGLSLVIIVMGLCIIFLIRRNYRKSKKIDRMSILETQNQLLQKENEKLELSKNLEQTSEELQTSILNIKKVALLKRELENIVDEKNPNYNEKETLKKIKLCLNSFFDNYRELTQMMQKKLNVDKIVDFVKKSYPEISEKEIRVIEYITLHFTTKEIALLMGKSEKSVEYYRSQIRKKIQLDKNESLEDFFISKIFV